MTTYMELRIRGADKQRQMHLLLGMFCPYFQHSVTLYTSLAIQHKITYHYYGCAVRALKSLWPSLIYCDRHLLLVKSRELDPLQDTVDPKKFDLLGAHVLCALIGVTGAQNETAVSISP
jgi:hypothetical protein